MIRVLIVDDHPSIRHGLSMLFAAEPDLEVCGLADTGEAGLDLAKTLRPDVVVMDLSMPGMGGIEATRAVASSGCGSRVLVLTCMLNEERKRQVVEAGAMGYLPKGEAPRRMLESLRAVARGERVVGDGPTG